MTKSQVLDEDSGKSEFALEILLLEIYFTDTVMGDSIMMILKSAENVEEFRQGFKYFMDDFWQLFLVSSKVPSEKVSELRTNLRTLIDDYLQQNPTVKEAVEAHYPIWLSDRAVGQEV